MWYGRRIVYVAAACCLGFAANAHAQCGAGAGDCCAPNGTPGCDDVACCESVCGADAFCCDSEWDQVCSDAAAADPNCNCGGGGAGCGAAGAGNCCIANGTPACDDADCCNAICGADPFCCDTAWDQICADAALANPACAKACEVDPVKNDNCADASPLTDGATEFSNVGSTTDGPPLEPNCEKGFGLSLINDIWYSYDATCDGTATFSTCNTATFDTRMAAYTGDCGALTQVACNDDGPGCAGFTSIMDVNVQCGTTYLIRLGGFDGGNSIGTGTLNVSCNGTECSDDCPGDLDGDGFAGPGDLAIILGNWGPCPGCPADINGDGVVGPADLAVPLGTWGPCK